MKDAGETWTFEIRDPQADRIYLVKESEAGFSSWIEMDRVAPDRWTVTTTLRPGHYRLRYFRAEGTTYFNGGSSGLVGRRVSSDADDDAPAMPLGPFGELQTA